MTCITFKNGAVRMRAGEIVSGADCCDVCPECEPGPKKVVLSLSATGTCYSAFYPDPSVPIGIVNTRADEAYAWLGANGFTHVTKTCFFDQGSANGPDCDWYCVMEARCWDWGPAPCGFYDYPLTCPDLFLPINDPVNGPYFGNSEARFYRDVGGTWVDDAAYLAGDRWLLGFTGGFVAPCGYVGVNPLP